MSAKFLFLCSMKESYRFGMGQEGDGRVLSKLSFKLLLMRRPIPSAFVKPDSIFLQKQTPGK